MFERGQRKLIMFNYDSKYKILSIKEHQILFSVEYNLYSYIIIMKSVLRYIIFETYLY